MIDKNSEDNWDYRRTVMLLLLPLLVISGSAILYIEFYAKFQEMPGWFSKISDIWLGIVIVLMVGASIFLSYNIRRMKSGPRE